ncbi:MAG: heme biosynthesis protein HemY [Rhodobiaceae bacterium]|nr:heme biosynthesis protein HemY [Rhodobiaceae bacterium]MCC0041221.1 heme biosynthesis protein HemY [Rhodobiaceae bacterium]
MIRVLTYLVGVLALGAGLAWLADRPGHVVMTWQGYEIQTSMMAMMLALIALCGFIIACWTLYRWIVEGPRAIGGYFRNRRRVHGYEALSRGMIAVGAGNAALALSEARQARKLLAGEPLVSLLSAQSAQLSGDIDGARKAFQDMLAAPDTALLGLHGLYVEAQRQGDSATAARFADEAVSRSPSLAWAAEAALAARVAEGNWDAALERLQKNHSSRLLEKAGFRRLKAVLLTARAQALEDREPAAAAAAAQEAVKLAPDLVPAAEIAGRLLAAEGRLGPASSLIEKAWKLAPHPGLAAVYAHVRSGDSVRDRLKRVKALAGKTPGDPEAAIAIANAAIEALAWGDARDALAPLLKASPSRRVCLLMAEIEEGEHGDLGRVREWLARAIRAPRDPAWVADGYVSDAWAPASPVTGRLDAFTWQVPDEDLAPPQAAVLEARAGADDGVAEPLMIDVSQRAAASEPSAISRGETAAAEPAADTKVASTGEEARRHDVATAESPDLSSSDTQQLDAQSHGSEEEATDDLGKDAEAIVIVPHAPDDPGPQAEGDEPGRKWLGIF